MNKLLKSAKPILFNTDMVRAILDGRKTQTRRVIKPQPPQALQFPFGFVARSTDKRDEGKFCWTVGETCDGRAHMVKPPYQPGDILWVRETWARDANGDYVYRTNYGSTEDDSFPPSVFKWRSSIHMPREAARIFLRVTDVRVERLQDITEEGAKAEGVAPFPKDPEGDCWSDGLYRTAFQYMWNEMYGWNPNSWDTNPWVWVIKFERMEGQADV